MKEEDAVSWRKMNCRYLLIRVNRLAVRKIPYRIADLKCDVQQKNKNDSNLRGFFFEKGGGDNPVLLRNTFIPVALFVHRISNAMCSAKCRENRKFG